ncbi:MAG TPA: hypothetical protein VFF43_18745, partial [Caldimonas sp.]|nr:hypothetical protein [Caldimonas sp.]
MRRLGAIFDDVERAGVAVGDLARLAQDRFEQKARVGLSRQPDADRIQLGEIALQPRTVRGGVEMSEGGGDGVRQHRRRRAERQDRVPADGPRSAIGGRNQTQHP